MTPFTKYSLTLVMAFLLCSTALAQTSTVAVEVQSVDAKLGKITVTFNGKTSTLTVTRDATVTVDGKAVDLSVLRPGDTASVDFDKAISAVTKISAKHKTIAPAEKLADGWDEIDDRLIFLMVRLANTEASLDAIEEAILKAGGKRNSSIAAGKLAGEGNDRMDRQGGGPMKWSTFYGRTAEKFFYHPVDASTRYHTETILSQQAPKNDNQSAAGVPSRQGLPVHQRPPQFDYIYRANQNAKERAEKEAAEFKGKLDALMARRRKLEAEESALWCEIAFRAISHYDLDKKPLYRFEPLVAEGTSKQNAEMMKVAAGFMVVALTVVDDAQKDQSGTFRKVKPAIANARQKLNDAWLQYGVDVTDKKSTEGKFAALAKKLEDVASNLSESYEIAVDGDREKDQLRKDTFRGLLQDSVVTYAQVVLALDEMSAAMKEDWKIKPDVGRPLAAMSLGNVRVANSSNIQSDYLSSEMKAIQGEWLCVAGAENGSPLEQNKVNQEKRRVIIKDNSLRMERVGASWDGKFEIDASNSHFDWVGKNNSGVATEWIGIYELNGDNLKLCFVWQKEGRSKRPTQFKTLPPSEPGMPHAFYTFERQSK